MTALGTRAKFIAGGSLAGGTLAGLAIAFASPQHLSWMKSAERLAPENVAAYERPYGAGAPWNVPVARLERHPESKSLAEMLWNGAPAARPGNFNLSFEEYTYPVYEAAEATGWYPVKTDWNSNIDGTEIPWNDEWKAASGTDSQAIVLDPESGREWNLWQVSFDGETVQARNGSLIKGDYRTYEGGNQPSRGSGIQYLAMLVRPEEIAQGRIRHALSMPIRNTDGSRFVPPATKLEHPGRPPGIPTGTRFALDVTDAEIDEWLASLPPELPEQTRNSARIIAEALRDYGWFITDSSGGAHFQFEDRASAGSQWDALGLGLIDVEWKSYPTDLLDGLLSADRIYAVLPGKSGAR